MKERDLIILDGLLTKVLDGKIENLPEAKKAKALVEKHIDPIETENTIGSRLNDKYRMHILVKFECLECGRHAILSKKEFEDAEKHEDVLCPYCRNDSLEWVSMMDDPDSLDELGCMGIGHLEHKRIVDDSF